VNYYDIFGISPEASPEDISAAHKALAKMYHPDINDSTDAHEKMAKLNEANEILSDTVKREKYDRKLERDRQQKENRSSSYSKSIKAKKYSGINNPDQRAGKAELLRKRAEARLKTEEAARKRRDEQAKLKAEETAKKRKQTRAELDKQHVINVLSAVVMDDNTQRSKQMKIDEERHYATKVLLSLIRKDDSHLQRMSEEAERKQRINEILSLVNEYNGKARIK